MTHLEKTQFAHELTHYVHLDDHLLLSYGGADGLERMFDMSTDPESSHPRLLTRVSPCEALPGHLAFRYLERPEARERTLSVAVNDETKREGILSRWGRVLPVPT